MNKVYKLRKENQEKINNYRRELQEELEKFCKETTGHEYWGWIDTSWFDITNELHKQKQRMCRYCHKREYLED